MVDTRVEHQRGAAAGAPAAPHLARLHHISVPVRDVEEASDFWTSTCDAERLPGSQPGFAAVRVADILVELSEQASGWTERGAEYPHCGFRFAPESMHRLRERLHAFGVPTSQLWTRHGKEALMYFCDPTGNLFEAACWHGMVGADALPRGDRAGGDYRIDFDALHYRWNPAIARTSGGPGVAPTQLDHLSLPVRNMAQTARFWIDVMGARPGRAPSHMVEIAGIDISFNAQPRGWTGWDRMYPHYAFAIEAVCLLPMKARLEAFGIPTHPICTAADGAAFMYFRDPAGNLFQLYCAEGVASMAALPSSTIADEDYVVDFAALNYTWAR